MNDSTFLERSIQIGALGNGNVSPNPMVGAVLVHEGKIIGEGYHKRYKEAHAEVNALANVKSTNQDKIANSTLFVSLEPCNIHRNTPPCSSLILEKNIPSVVIGQLDSTPEVSGKSLTLLNSKGVQTNFLPHPLAAILAEPRNVFVQQHRPKITLKFAQSIDGYLGKQGEATRISNAYTQRWVHRLRSQVGAIMVGTQTALIDQPSLTNRFAPGKSPLRIFPDFDHKVPESASLFDDAVPTWKLATTLAHKPASTKIVSRENWIEDLFGYLLEANINHLFIEGGQKLLQTFIDRNLWDEAIVITGKGRLEVGIRAPTLEGRPQRSFTIVGDKIDIYVPKR